MEHEYGAKMDQQNRAKQFAPFAALKGYEEKINEIGRDNMDSCDRYMDNDSQVPVPVIASFSKTGDIVPLYFSTSGLRIKVASVKWHDTDNKWGCHFRCEIIVDNILKEVDLFYYRQKNVWTLRHY